MKMESAIQKKTQGHLFCYEKVVNLTQNQLGQDLLYLHTMNRIGFQICLRLTLTTYQKNRKLINFQARLKSFASMTALRTKHGRLSCNGQRNILTIPKVLLFGDLNKKRIREKEPRSNTVLCFPVVNTSSSLTLMEPLILMRLRRSMGLLSKSPISQAKALVAQLEVVMLVKKMYSAKELEN